MALGAWERQECLLPPAPLECAAGRARLSQGKAVTCGVHGVGATSVFPNLKGILQALWLSSLSAAFLVFPNSPASHATVSSHLSPPHARNECLSPSLHFPPSLPPSEGVLLPFSLRALLGPGPGWLLGATPCPRRPQLHRLLVTTEEISAARTRFVAVPENSHGLDQSERVAAGLQR